MLRIALEEVEVRFRRKSLFPPLSYQFESGNTYALTGPNGSGKTTLLRVIAGQKRPDAGHITWSDSLHKLEPENWHTHLAWAGPYLEFPQDLQLQDLIRLHFWFKSPLPGISISEIPALLDLKLHLDKKVKLFSSGMMHRLKTGLTLLTDSKVLLLDEPTANMDTHNRDRILELIRTYTQQRLVIIASNMAEEYAGVQHIIRIS